MRHAGIHWPENAGGEHPNRDAILALPGMQGAVLICSPSARYHYDYIRRCCPGATVVWRAIPRRGKLPAELSWNPKRVADECLNLWDEQPHGGAEFFLPLNELQFDKENGGPFPGYGVMAQHLGGLRQELRRRFTGQNVRLMFPGWVPSDDGDHLEDWRAEAANWDAVCVHCYGSAETMRERYQSYRAAFPNTPLFVGEWNSNHERRDERLSLLMWAEIAGSEPYPLFLGATYYIWETNNDGENDLSIWGNSDRLALFRNPPASLPDLIPDPEPIPMNEGEIFIRDAASRRGIDPDIAVRVAMSEGGTMPPGNIGKFETGWSFWPFQLHYGGEGYEYLGTDAGMGNGFTKLTGWAPGDPAAWKDATRCALNQAKLGGWTPWYGAAHVGIGQWDGIDRDHPWNAMSETWDYEAGVTPPAVLAFNPDAPCDVQPDDWSCSIQSAQWLLRSIGRNPGDRWMEEQLIPVIVSRSVGLQDASGQQMAAWINREYGSEMGFTANAAPVTFDDVLAGAGVNPTLIGGRAWGSGGHWAGVRRADENGLLELANPAPGYTGVGTHLDRAEWDARGPWSAIYIDRGAVAAPIPVPVPPVPAPPAVDPRDARIKDLEARIETLRTQLDDARTALGVATTTYAQTLEDVVKALRALKPAA